MVWIPIIVTIFVVLVLIIRSIRLKPIEHIYKKLESKIIINPMITAEKLSEIIQCRTISHSNYESCDFNEFIKARELLKMNFPLVHEHLELEIVNDYSLLYKWQGKNPEKKPGLFMAHLDVVPVEKGTASDWEQPPFSGNIKDGYLWGRGAIDIKSQLVTMLEACEILLLKDFIPDRTIYFAFGHDEETDDSNGARKIVERLTGDGIGLDFVNDEGGCINTGVFSSIKKPTAFIGLAEKGYLNVKVTVRGTGGHSSTPPKNSSLGLAAKIICRLEDKKMKRRLTESSRKTIISLGRHMGFASRLIIANLWIFKTLFIRLFSTSGTTGEALLRTTIAPTMASGSMEPNVLPQSSSFIVNCRILHGETSDDVIKHIAKACKGIDTDISVLRLEEPSSVSSEESEIFSKIAGAVRGIKPDAAIIPYLMVAGTDSVKYQGLCKNIIRFSPFTIDIDDMKRIHGTNEKISLQNIEDCVRFYHSLFNSL